MVGSPIGRNLRAAANGPAVLVEQRELEACRIGDLALDRHAGASDHRFQRRYEIVRPGPVHVDEEAKDGRGGLSVCGTAQETGDDLVLRAPNVQSKD